MLLLEISEATRSFKKQQGVQSEFQDYPRYTEKPFFRKREEAGSGLERWFCV